MPTFAEWMLDPGAPPDVPPVFPPWLLDPTGKAWARTIGQHMDGVVSRCRDAVKASFPAFAPSDALPIIGLELGMPRGTVEPEDAYRARLAAAWDLWQYAGTAYGILLAARYAGYPNVLLQGQVGVQWSLATALTGNPSADLISSAMPTPVHLGGTPTEKWNDFAALILQPWPTWWNGAAPADGSNDQKTFAALLTQWKSAVARCVKLEVVQGPTWGLMTWGAFTWGAGTVTTWTPPT